MGKAMSDWEKEEKEELSRKRKGDIRAIRKKEKNLFGWSERGWRWKEFGDDEQECEKLLPS
jgi:hypothetical protein